MTVPAPTQLLPPAARLLELTSEAQDLYPNHTFKASMYLIDQLESVEEKCERLEAGMAEFRRGLPDNHQERGR